MATRVTDLPGSAVPRSTPARSTPARLAQPLGLAAAAGLGALALHLRDPHASGSWGFCPLLLTTGVACPGCGGLRAVNDLTDLRLVDAASSNLLLVALLPAVAAYWLVWVRNAATGRPRPRIRWTPTGVVAAVLVVVVFVVLRNSAPGAWLAP